VEINKDDDDVKFLTSKNKNVYPVDKETGEIKSGLGPDLEGKVIPGWNNEPNNEQNNENSKGFSANDENPSIPPMSESNLNKHWGSGFNSDHSKQYPNFTKEQYANRALELARSKTSDNIIGYISDNGSIVRYDIQNNDWVRAYGTGPATLFKPSRGIDYYNDVKKSDGGKNV